MDEESKLFRWGTGLTIAVFVLTAALQVCYRANDKMRARVRLNIVKTQQEIAETTSDFAAYVRPEVLRNLVFSIYPESETINFNKSVSINNLSLKK